ncbi:MAG: hypothetical protein MR051_00220 [Lentisphaeria bacterium]|nr:hypothetical protein [Lentisphaeria bacterium]
MSSAVELFTAVPRQHNCAQAVAAGAGRDDLIEVLAHAGAGKAPDGMCGALYAALQIIPESRRENARRNFVNFAGSDICVILKMRNRIPCIRCVEKAAELVERYGIVKRN